MNPDLKRISYRGGLVTFRVPAHWREEYAAEGGACFYEDAPGSSTFRLEVVTARTPSPVTSTSAADLLTALQPSAAGRVEVLPNGCALIRYSEPVAEQGHQLYITYWLVAHVIPPRHVRVATFSLTLLDHQRTEVRFQREVELLDREVRASVFSPDLGDMPR